MPARHARGLLLELHQTCGGHAGNLLVHLGDGLGIETELLQFLLGQHAQHAVNPRQVVAQFLQILDALP